MTNNCYQKHKEACEKYQNLSEEEKTKAKKRPEKRSTFN